MPVWTQSVEQVCNAALAHIGFPLRIADVYDGSDRSKIVLDIYGQTRDETLRANDWDFAARTVALTLLKSAPTIPGGYGYFPPVTWNPAVNPPLPWLFEYQFPVDCIKVRCVKPQPMFVPNFDPQPHTFTIVNDNSISPPARVILTDVQAALLVYTAQIIDMTTWDVGFADALIAALGKRLAPALAKLSQAGIEGVKMEMAEEAGATSFSERESV